MRYFGIKSYLDNFYGRRQGDQQIDSQYLIRSNRPKFSSRWWKVLLWLGSFFVGFGILLLMIGFILPRKKIEIDNNGSLTKSETSHIITIDRQALAYNSQLDTSRLAGICFVVLGGFLFVLSLLLPTFCHMWCASSDTNDEVDPFKMKMEASGGEKIIPVQSTPKSIQPHYNKNESRLTTDGIVPLSTS